MKKTQLKELIKQSMLELNNPKNMGAMTPDEEKMVSDYEEEEANKYALDSENPLDEARISPDSRVKYLAQSLEYIWNMGKGNNTTDYTSMAQSLIDDMFSEEPLDENMGSMPEDIEWEWDGEVYDRIDYHSGDIGLEGYSPSTGRNYTASVMADYNGDTWDWSNSNIDYIEEVPVRENKMSKETKNKATNLRERKEPLSKLIRKADRIVEAWTSKKLIKEADLSQANFDDLTQVVRNIAHINEVGMEEAAMQAIEYIAEQFDVPVDFKDFD